MTEKRSFWRFGGRLDKIYNWLVGISFILFLFIYISQADRNHLPEAIGVAIGQLFWVAIILFVVFKIISAVKNRKG